MAETCRLDDDLVIHTSDVAVITKGIHHCDVVRHGSLPKVGQTDLDTLVAT